MRSAISLRRQLLRWLLALLLPLLVAGVGVSYYAAHYFANLAYDRSLLRAALALADQVEVKSGKVVIELPQAATDLLEYDKDDWVYYRVIGPLGETVIGDTSLAAPPLRPLRKDHLYFDAVLDHKPVRVVAFWLPLKGTSLSGEALVLVAETLSKREFMTEEITIAMVIPQLLMLVLAAVLVWYGVRRGLLPLDRLQAEIGQRSHRDMSALRMETAPKEVQPLLLAMNGLMLRLQEAMSLQQRFIADASHQLRTPLAGLQTQAEMAMRESDPARVRHALEHICASAARFSHLVQQLLSLAKVEPASGRQLNMVMLDINQLAREVTETLVSTALAKQVDLGFEGNDAPLVIKVDGFLLRELLTNIVDNAIRYTPNNGEVTVRVEHADGVVAVTVEDNGPGIPPELRAKVFEPFYRIDEQAAEGCGLGLAIAKEIALLHQAEILIEDGRSGKGTRVVVRLPL